MESLNSEIVGRGTIYIQARLFVFRTVLKAINPRNKYTPRRHKGILVNLRSS
jgi:hypothetical protein